MNAGVTTGRGARRLLSGLAVGVAAMTGAVAASIGGSTEYVLGAVGYLVVTAAAVAAPAAIGAQVVGGQILLGGLLLDPRGPGTALLVALVAAVVATAELLGTAAGLRAPFDGRGSVSRNLEAAGLGAGVGALAFFAVLTVAGLEGPTGLLATSLASAACAGLAALLVRSG